MNPIDVTLRLDLDAYIATHYSYDEDGEPNAPRTVEDIIIDSAAKQLLQDAVGPRSVLREHISNIRKEAIRERILPLIEEALSGPIRPTNAYGEPKAGETTTLRELISKQVEETLHRPYDSYSRDTFVKKFIKSEVEKALKAELKSALDAAVNEVKAAAKEQAATLLADAIRRTASALP